MQGVVEFSEEDLKLAALCKALAHPARIRILKMLDEKQICICNDLVSNLPLSQATVSQHLKELRKADLILAEEQGPRVCYSINMDRALELKDQLHGYLSTLKLNEI